MDMQVLVRLLWRRQQLKQHDRWSRKQLLYHQTAALHHLRQYAYAHSPFYQRFHQGLFDRPLEELPVLTKAILMENFDELVTDRIVRREEVRAHLTGPNPQGRYLSRYWINATSGSTGRQGLFIFNMNEWTTILASYARASDWTGLKIGLLHRTRFAVVSSTTPWHQSAVVGATINSRFVPTLRIDSGDPMETIVARLNDWQPAMLTAYASMAALLAEEQLAGRLHIAPSAVTSASEVLTETMRRRIKEAWGVAPFDVYGATETATIASECNMHCGQHLFEDLVIAELVYKDNRPVPDGVYADKLLVTVLFSRTLPLIRYEMSDSVMLSAQRSQCNFPYRLLAGIQGRSEDVLNLPTKAGGSVEVQPIVFHRVMENVPAGEWQLVQEGDRLRVLLAYVYGDFSDDTLIAALTKELETIGAQVPTVQVERVAAIPRGITGKAPLIKSNIPLASSKQ